MDEWKGVPMFNFLIYLSTKCVLILDFNYSEWIEGWRIPF